MKRSTGIVLAVLGAGILLSVCVVAIVAAIAIPAFLGAKERAKERGKQAQAVADIRRIAAACEDYYREKQEYPPFGEAREGFEIVDAHYLWNCLFYSCTDCPFTDPWGNPYGYGATWDRREFVLVCRGSDNKMNIDKFPVQHVSTHCFEDDIIWRNGGFIQEPEGQQKKCR